MPPWVAAAPQACVRLRGGGGGASTAKPTNAKMQQRSGATSKNVKVETTNTDDAEAKMKQRSGAAGGGVKAANVVSAAAKFKVKSGR